MKYPEYDSPFELTISDIATQVGKDIDKMTLKAVQKVGISVDKDKLLAALKQDAERYREAYAHGYDTGYETRDEEIIRCSDCRHYGYKDMTNVDGFCYCLKRHEYPNPDWYCADAERRDDDA